MARKTNMTPMMHVATMKPMASPPIPVPAPSPGASPPTSKPLLCFRVRPSPMLARLMVRPWKTSAYLLESVFAFHVLFIFDKNVPANFRS